MPVPLVDIIVIVVVIVVVVVVVVVIVVVVIIVVFMTIILIVWSCICSTSAPDHHKLQIPINARPAAM